MIRRTHRQNAESDLKLADDLARHAANALLLAAEHAENARDHHDAQAEYHATESVAAAKLHAAASRRLDHLDKLA